MSRRPPWRFVLVRHGETEWNKKGIYRGRADVPLNARGRAQARAAGKALSGIRDAAVFASPLGRTVETAGLIRKSVKGASFAVEPGLQELDRGAWQGLTRAQARRRYPRIYEAWYHQPSRARFPGGESLRAVQRRARAAFERLRQDCRSETAVIVSHNVVLRALICSLLDLPLDRFQSFELSPGSVTELVFEFGRYALRRLNDRCHLAQIEDVSQLLLSAD